MSNDILGYFGEGCQFFCGQWTDYYKYPVLNFCQHKDNQSSYEGNCCESFCPLKLSKPCLGISSIEKIEYEDVVFSDGTNYARYSPDSWSRFYGMSLEVVHDDKELKYLEECYQHHKQMRKE